MATKRQPLANNTNAINSPFRAPTLKRPRSNAVEVIDLEPNQSPPKKRQLLEAHGTFGRTQHASLDHADAKVFTDRPNVQPSAFQRKLTAVRDEKWEQLRAKEIQRNSNQQQETLVAWRRHYKRIFPSFNFYFENLPQDVATKSSRKVEKLGARQERFFSRSVTHVITTRPIPEAPAEVASTSRHAINSKQSGIQSQTLSGRTINPSLLDRPADLLQQRAQTQRRIQGPLQELDPRKHQGNHDILHRAKEMGMKIWALEKFERMLATLLSGDLVEDNPRIQGQPVKLHRDQDLQKMLQREKLEAQIGPQNTRIEIVPFTAYYVSVRDMDEKVKPILIREFEVTEEKKDGDWPMLRSVSAGRCPFVEEVPVDKEKHAKGAKPRNDEPTTRKATHDSAKPTLGAPKVNAPRTRSQTRSPARPPLQESVVAGNQMAKPPLPKVASKANDPPTLSRQNSGSIPSMPPMMHGRGHFRGLSQNHGGDPVASGMRANQTSAIRSQAISSTAPAPGVRLGQSQRPPQHLNRRVLEKQSGLSANSMTSTYMNDVRAALNTDQAHPRLGVHNAGKHEALCVIAEDETLSEDEESQPQCQAQKRPRTTTKKTKKPTVREPKPGYCENCRDKYEDFHEHIDSKKHQKFAMDKENWTELDVLLQKLERV